MRQDNIMMRDADSKARHTRRCGLLPIRTDTNNCRRIDGVFIETLYVQLFVILVGKLQDIHTSQLQCFPTIHTLTIR